MHTVPGAAGAASVEGADFPKARRTAGPLRFLRTSNAEDRTTTPIANQISGASRSAVRSALERAPTPAFGIGADRSVRFVNAAGWAFLDAETDCPNVDRAAPEALVFEPDGDLHPVDRLLNGDPVERASLFWRSPLGERRRCFCDGGLIDEADPSGAVAILYLSPAIEEPRQRDPLRREVGEIAAHFARTHLRILPRLKLAMHWANDARAVEAISGVLEDLREPAETSRRLLNFAGRRPWIEDHGRLDEVFEVVGDVARRGAGPELSIEIERPPNLSLRCDRSQLEIAILNLIANARDAVASTGEPGRVRVHASMPDETPNLLEVVVADNGPGMAPDELEKAKEPFYSTRGGDADGARVGAGVGLSIAEGFCKRLGGELTLASGGFAGPSRGLTAVMRLPV